MREFIYYSKSAVTAGNRIKEDLMKAGRLDIACQIVIHGLFVSRHMRLNVKLHLVFDGPPDAPKHLEIFPGVSGKDNLGDIENKIDISKKDIAGLIKRMLYKYRVGEKKEVANGYWIEKRGFADLVFELHNEGKEIFILDKRGEDIRKVEISENAVFIIGDQEGIPKKELKRIKGIPLKRVSVGPQTLFASQALIVLQNELDRRSMN